MNTVPQGKIEGSGKIEGLTIAYQLFEELSKEDRFKGFDIEMLNDGQRIWFAAKGKRSFYIPRTTLEESSSDSLSNLLNEALEALNLDSFTRLPSLKQPGESCRLIFGYGMSADNCTILKVHFTKEKVQYDVEAILDNWEDPKSNGWHKVRFYNVDQEFVKDIVRK